jgi:hypothetical protein
VWAAVAPGPTVGPHRVPPSDPRTALLPSPALPDPGETRVVGQRLVEGLAQVPAVGQVEIGGLDEFPLRADAFEEHDELELENSTGSMLGRPRSA